MSGSLTVTNHRGRQSRYYVPDAPDIRFAPGGKGGVVQFMDTAGVSYTLNFDFIEEMAFVEAPNDDDGG